MIFSVMKTKVLANRIGATKAIVVGAAFVFAALPALGDKKPQLVKPIAGPRATALRVTPLYVSPDMNAQKVDRVQIGREMVVAEKSGPWVRVYANTDIEEEHQSDTPVFGTSDTPPPISGWMEAKGVVEDTTPNGDQVSDGGRGQRGSFG